MAAHTPEDVDRLFAERVNAGDAAGVAELYEKEGVLVFEGTTFRGSDQIRAFLEGMTAAHARIAMDVKHVVGAGDGAVLYDDWSMTVTGPDGKPEASSGKAIQVVRRQPDGTWKLVIDDPTARD
ncbi:MAG: SgcJ/EcaC family oxidoreductase [Deltaproteobacteria bacterium]|nr:SgcJ/EcaC family oxidoreductase [Deltaproteobacteria bacterium]